MKINRNIFISHNILLNRIGNECFYASKCLGKLDHEVKNTLQYGNSHECGKSLGAQGGNFTSQHRV